MSRKKSKQYTEKKVEILRRGKKTYTCGRVGWKMTKDVCYITRHDTSADQFVSNSNSSTQDVL